MRKNLVLKGVLFDVDGTLVDSNKQHAGSWRDALTEAGYHLPFEKIFRAIGMGADNLLPALINLDGKSDEGKRLSERSRVIFEHKYLSSVQPFIGAQELLFRTEDAGLKVGVATSANEQILEKLLEIAGVAGIIKNSVSASAVENSKPDPDVIVAAANRIDVSLNEVIMVGDTPYDIEAARKVGVPTIGLTCGGWSSADLSGAMGVYKSPAELVEDFDNSPLGRGFR